MKLEMSPWLNLSSHEGSGRHSRQHGGVRDRRFGKFTANYHRVCSLLRPSFCELIVNVMGHIAAVSPAAVIRYLATIPAWSFTWRRGCRSCLFSRGRGCRSALTRVPLCTVERRASLIITGNILAHAGKYQLFGEHYRLFSHSFTRISKIVLEFKMCFNSNTIECHLDLPPGFYVICVKNTLKHRAF